MLRCSADSGIYSPKRSAFRPPRGGQRPSQPRTDSGIQNYYTIFALKIKVFQQRIFDAVFVHFCAAIHALSAKQRHVPRPERQALQGREAVICAIFCPQNIFPVPARTGNEALLRAAEAKPQRQKPARRFASGGRARAFMRCNNQCVPPVQPRLMRSAPSTFRMVESGREPMRSFKRRLSSVRICSSRMTESFCSP